MKQLRKCRSCWRRQFTGKRSNIFIIIIKATGTNMSVLDFFFFLKDFSDLLGNFSFSQCHWCGFVRLISLKAQIAIEFGLHLYKFEASPPQTSGTVKFLVYKL